MLSKNQFYWVNLCELIWGNRIIRARIIGSLLSFPVLFFIMILTMEYYQLPIPIGYCLIFLSGLYYHLYVTIFSISMVYSYLKFLSIHRMLLKTILLIYLIGLMSSLVNCSILIGLISLHYIQVEVGQVYLAFVLSNFIMMPLCLWIASFDYVKTDLFIAKVAFYQPSSLHFVVAVLSMILFNLIIAARTEFNWPLNTVLIALLILVILTGIVLKPMITKIYVNCQNTIAS